jgi:hypothetical protein
MTYPNPHGPSCPWHDITESHGAANIKWCEETLCQWISEPANTWSNLGYLIVGLFVTYIAFSKKYHRNLKQFGPIIFLMGAGSFYYHQSNFYTSQIVDFVGMFFFVGWAIGMNLIRLGKLKYQNLLKFNLGLSAFYTLAMHIMYKTGVKFQIIVLISGFLIIGTEILARKIKQVEYKWFYLTIITLIAAFSFSISDNRRIWCNPTDHSWIGQGHAMWHWIASIAMYFIFRHYSQPALREDKT